MRSLPRDARHERRVQVIRLCKAGVTYDAIAEQVGLSRTGVRHLQATRRGGAKALRDAIGGCKFGEGRVLKLDQERQVQQLIRDRTPARTKLQLVEAASRHLRSVQKQPQRILAYFQHE